MVQAFSWNRSRAGIFAADVAELWKANVEKVSPLEDSIVQAVLIWARTMEERSAIPRYTKCS